MRTTLSLTAGLSLVFILAQSVPVFSEEIPAAMTEMSPATADMIIPAVEQPRPQPHLADSLTITVTPVELDSGLLGRSYKGYLVKVTNNGPHNVSLENSHIENGVNGEDAYQLKKKKLIGITSFLGASGFVTTAIRRKIRNNTAKHEGPKFTNKFVDVPIAPGASSTTMTLVSKKEAPKIRIAAKDLTTGEQYEVSQHGVTTTASGDPTMIPVSNISPE
jgi:hypothetical protein